jgi:hypothetical protein
LVFCWGALGFLLWLGLCGCFFFLVSLVFFALFVFASFCVLPVSSGALSSFIKFLLLTKKKKKKRLG